jgi:hypothetical protein
VSAGAKEKLLPTATGNQLMVTGPRLLRNTKVVCRHVKRTRDCSAYVHVASHK